MKVHDDHMYHGAALIQIAEHPRFTSINSLKLRGQALRSAYRVNDLTGNDIGVYLKYAHHPSPSHEEYMFTFSEDNLTELEKINKKVDALFLTLVCVHAEEICCLSYEELLKLVERRTKAKGSTEHQYVVLVTVRNGKSMRVYVNMPGVKNKILGKPLIIKRNEFPSKIFI